MAIIKVQGPPEPGQRTPPLGQRLFWFVGLWLAGLATITAVAYGLRFLLR